MTVQRKIERQKRIEMSKEDETHYQRRMESDELGSIEFSSDSEVQVQVDRVGKKEYYVVHRTRGAISHWWRSLQILSFFIVAVSGIASCISLGRLRNSFSDTCILFADWVILEGANLTSGTEIEPQYVQKNGFGSSCSFCEYAPMFGTSTAILLAALYLMCGKGDASKRMTVNDSWKLVVPTLPFAFIFFIISCVVLGNTVGGLLYFCYNIIDKSHESLHIESCPQVYNLKFPHAEVFTPIEISSINRYANFVIAEVGTSLHFVGWFLALFILGIRCYFHADFIVLTGNGNVPELRKNDYLRLEGDEPLQSDSTV